MITTCFRATSSRPRANWACALSNWRCLRTSHGDVVVEAGANPKDVQGQMRHSRISTTMDIYAQCAGFQSAGDAQGQLWSRQTAGKSRLAVAGRRW